MRIKNLIAVMMLLASQALWADEQTVNKYVVVWDSISQENPMYKKHIKKQAEVLTGLWEKGVIENIYFNLESNQPKAKSEQYASIVFFIKAKNKDDANKTLKELPFVKHDVLNYTLSPAGYLWLKQSQNNKI